MAKRAFFLLTLMLGALPCFAQKHPIDSYTSNADFNDAAAGAPGSRDNAKILAILPVRKSTSFANYVAAKTAKVDYATLLQDVDKLRLNKQVGSAAGASGITSLVSSVAVPALIGVGVEYGSILQSTNGNTTTLRANLLGVSRMLLGAEQFPYCPVIDQAGCTLASRWARRFSGSASFENVNNTTATGTAVPVTTNNPTVVDLFGDGFRMASWGARFDITANDPSDPGYISRFKQTIDTLRGSHTPADLAASVEALFGDTNIQPVYLAWQTETLAILQAAPQAEFKQKLGQQLDILIDKLATLSPDFYTKVATLRRASQNYLSERDDLLQAIQSHKFSVEYTNLHSLNQPSTSNVRLIFSHQPSAAPILLTANAAVTWYNSLPATTSASRLRDVQAAGQLDRRLGVIPNLGNAVMTLAGYYQWMKEDALITIGPGNVAPGSGILLPGTAATLLGTKGNIGVVQGRLTLPINNTIKIPISVTWSNRKELINESETRGQVGITLDLDSLFR
ncbi:MAG: hypothetical protein LAO76_24315 [Acidobacteriia bacterium]|nr:hypothetical protein [Terriglobia bacterium]